MSITIPSRHGVVQAGSGARAPSTPTRHTRQAPNGAWRSSKHSVGTLAPAARIALRIVVSGSHLDRMPVDGDLHQASPSSSAKWASRLRIGAGMPPPCAHSAAELERLQQLLEARRGRPALGGEHVVGAAQADPAGEALAAALVRAEAQQVARQVAHVGVVVESDDAAVADHAALAASASKSNGVSSCEAGRIPPSGPPICSALI